MIEPKTKPYVKLIGEDGNAFAIIGRISKALKQAGADGEYIRKFHEEAMSGNYDKVLQTAMKYANMY